MTADCGHFNTGKLSNSAQQQNGRKGNFKREQTQALLLEQMVSSAVTVTMFAR